ncbi:MULTISPECIES: hypothetical protein [Pseudomonas]|uniref:hypothetical protein n=1 Tax=Pseudomonas TaxID=286 RepID=UPI0007612D1A|nr:MULTISPECIES: hypothetical protein [Pseudomonas]
MDKRLSAVLACLAFTLSSVTAISVAMTVFSLIDDPFLRFVFAGAAVLLDVFKYLAWPVAVRLINEKFRLAAAGLLFCSVTLGAVSGWATYDRLVGSINVSHAKHEALSGDRAAQLTTVIKKDSDFLAALVDAEKKANSESAALRDRGMVTKAQDLESVTISRIDTQRQAAMERIKTNSLEIAEIQSTTTKASSIPAFLAALICAGFALSLELVPALILAIPSSRKLEVGQDTDVQDLQPTTQVSLPPSQNLELMSNNNPLLETLLQRATTLPQNSKIKVKDFATENRVGNVKACEVFKQAEELGVIQKTRLGYLTTSITAY